MKKTAMQLMIEFMNGEDSTVVPFVDKKVLKKATELLETEREHIIVAHANGIYDASNCINGEPFKTSEQYYKETYA